MKRRIVLLISSAMIFSFLLSIVVFPPVFAKNNDRNNGSHRVTAKAGNTNKFGGNSDSRASVNNDNSVHITQNKGGGSPVLNRNNNHKDRNNKNNHKNDRDKKIVKKHINNTTVENVYINEENPQKVILPPEVIVPPVINENVNENVNENINTVEVPPQEVIHDTVVVEKPVEKVVVEERVVEKPVQEVAYYEDYEVYPAREIAVTPETGSETLALSSLPLLAGAGLFLRRKFLH
jgi:hypothetical protein